MLKATENVHLDWGNFYSSWSISHEELRWAEQMLLKEFYFLYSSLGCIMGQNQREPVAEGKRKPSSYFVVLRFPSGPGPGMPCSVGKQASQPWGARPRGIHRSAEVLRFLELMTWRGTGFPLWQEPHARNFMSRRPHRLRPIFFNVQRTSCKLGKYSDHLTDRTTSSAQNLLCFRLLTRGIRSMVINLSHSWY